MSETAPTSADAHNALRWLGQVTGEYDRTFLVRRYIMALEQKLAIQEGDVRDTERLDWLQRQVHDAADGSIGDVERSHPEAPR